MQEDDRGGRGADAETARAVVSAHACLLAPRSRRASLIGALELVGGPLERHRGAWGTSRCVSSKAVPS